MIKFLRFGVLMVELWHPGYIPVFIRELVSDELLGSTPRVSDSGSGAQNTDFYQSSTDGDHTWRTTIVEDGKRKERIWVLPLVHLGSVDCKMHGPH